MNDTTAIDCPSHFALDDRELHAGGGRALGPHVEDCLRCRARLDERAAAQAGFDAQAAPLWTRIAARGQERARRTRWRRAFAALAALLLSVGAAALWFGPRAAGPGARPYVGAKGGAPIEIICRRDGVAFPLAPDDGVTPGDELRFRPLPVWPEARFIQVGSVDGTGRYSPFYPSEPGGRSVALPAAGAALHGSIRLDDAPGPERLFVVLSGAPLSAAAVRQVAESSAAAGTTVDRIEGTLVRAAWIVLPKGARPPAGERSAP
jgi:hypothetical protein